MSLLTNLPRLKLVSLFISLIRPGIRTDLSMSLAVAATVEADVEVAQAGPLRKLHLKLYT
jgi:hypothetical protein